MALLVKRKRQTQVLGIVSLSTASVIGLMLLLSKVFLYKLQLLGPELLFGGALAAVMLFLLASVFFFNYPKLFLRVDRPGRGFQDDAQPATIPTNKLLNDPPFEPASVTEHSTELLRTKAK